MKKIIKKTLLLSIIILLSSCWTYYDTTGAQKQISVIDVAEAVHTSIVPPTNEMIKKVDNQQKSIVGEELIGKETNNLEEWNQRNGNGLKLSKTYNGWWVYGEGQHIFKDEESLEEWNLEFSNENMEELQELYLAICEMEYFPMECEMIGYKRKDILGNETTLIVSEFNILYIQGCGE